MERLLKSYEMMLGFYGIKLVDRETGQVLRAENWKERFHNLNRFVCSSHRYKAYVQSCYTITRVLRRLFHRE